MEKTPHEHNESHEETPRPNALDIIKINGRWAQFSGGGTVKYLDDQSGEFVDWDALELMSQYLPGQNLVKYQKDFFTEQEIANVHWGPEDKENPKLKEQVTVFGEYETKR